MFFHAISSALARRVLRLAICAVLLCALSGCYPPLFWHPVAPIQFKSLLDRAEKGDTDAQLKASRMLACGRFSCGFGPWRPDCDDAASMKWLRRSAEAGNAKAQQFLGEALDPQVNQYPKVEKNRDEAIKWYQRAAAQGHISAYMSLAADEENQQNLVVAAGWYRKAADAGYGIAQLKLAKSYATGNGLPKDSQQARYWVEKAAVNTTDEEADIADIYAKMTPPDNVEAYYWAGLKSARIRKNLDGGSAPWLDRALEQDDVYFLRLMPAQASAVDKRISIQIDEDCKTLLRARNVKSNIPDRDEATRRGPVHYCLERQKK